MIFLLGLYGPIAEKIMFGDIWIKSDPDLKGIYLHAGAARPVHWWSELAARLHTGAVRTCMGVYSTWVRARLHAGAVRTCVGMYSAWVQALAVVHQFFKQMI